MKILVTRPLEDAEETAQQLAAGGHQALVAPLLATQFHDGPPLSLDGVQAVLATSANGVRALIRRTARRDLPLFAVGPQTAQAASVAGFADVRNADGDAKALAQAAQKWARPESGPLLHVRGTDVAGSLADNLRRSGFSVREDILYAVIPQPFPAKAMAALRAGEVDAALFFSPRGAQIFRDGALKESLPVVRVVAACISQATAASLTPLLFRQTRIASAPNQAALLASLR